MEPPIRNDGDIIIRRDRLEHRDSDCDIMFVFGVALAENESVMEEDDFTVNIFDKNIECLCGAMYLLVPAEIWND